MAQTDISKLKAYFQAGNTLRIDFRKTQLRILLSAIKANESKLIEALAADLGKSPFESYATEIGMIKEEIRLHIRRLGRWSRVRRQPTSLTSIPASSYTETIPYGVSLIISPWNYPIQLALMPLVAAISAGNCAVLKPSEYSEACTKVIDELINENFDPDYVRVIKGDSHVSQELLKQSFDHIFFTGSTRVGKIVMKAAAEQLIPIVLELGGKSPCIVDKNANISQAARRIVWGKCINAGQTCIAPDYLLVHKDVKKSLLDAMKIELTSLFGNHPTESSDYPKIINQPNFERLKQIMQCGKIVVGGELNTEKNKIGFTALDSPDMQSPLMKEEIFGPLLPIICWEKPEDIFTTILLNKNPLALYIFTKDRIFEKTIRKNVPAGGITVNDTLMHFTNAALPFGGIGQSGLGSYHGKAGFMAFSHQRSLMRRATWIDIPLRYAPYKNKIKLLKWLMR